MDDVYIVVGLIFSGSLLFLTCCYKVSNLLYKLCKIDETSGEDHDFLSLAEKEALSCPNSSTNALHLEDYGKSRYVDSIYFSNDFPTKKYPPKQLRCSTQPIRLNYHPIASRRHNGALLIEGGTYKLKPASSETSLRENSYQSTSDPPSCSETCLLQTQSRPKCINHEVPKVELNSSMSTKESSENRKSIFGNLDNETYKKRRTMSIGDTSKNMFGLPPPIRCITKVTSHSNHNESRYVPEQMSTLEVAEQSLPIATKRTKNTWKSEESEKRAFGYSNDICTQKIGSFCISECSVTAHKRDGNMLFGFKDFDTEGLLLPRYLGGMAQHFDETVKRSSGRKFYPPSIYVPSPYGLTSLQAGKEENLNNFIYPTYPSMEVQHFCAADVQSCADYEALKTKQLIRDGERVKLPGYHIIPPPKSFNDPQECGQICYWEKE